MQQAKASLGLITVQSNDNGNPEQSVGTCFVVNDEGYALTAAHLFPVGRPGTRATVSLGSAFSPAYPAELVRVDQDLALIRIRGVPSFAPIKLAQTRIRVAQSVFIMGFPASSDIALLQGNVSSTDQARGGIGIIAATSPGMSGSPVFNDAGEVEAVVNGRIADTGMTIAYPFQLGATLLLSVDISR